MRYIIPILLSFLFLTSCYDFSQRSINDYKSKFSLIDAKIEEYREENGTYPITFDEIGCSSDHRFFKVVYYRNEALEFYSITIEPKGSGDSYLYSSQNKEWIRLEMSF